MSSADMLRAPVFRSRKPTNPAPPLPFSRAVEQAWNRHNKEQEHHSALHSLVGLFLGLLVDVHVPLEVDRADELLVAQVARDHAAAAVQ